MAAWRLAWTRFSAAFAPAGPALRLAAVGVIIATFLWEFQGRPVLADDAYISFRYAANLVHGHGLVFNAGEYVEGYTNLLWTLLIAGCMWLGGDPPEISRVLSLIFGSLALALCYVYAARLVPRRFAWLAVLAPCVMYASNAFACWMMTGLETPLFLFLSTAALISFDAGRPFATAAICALALLTRPEGGLEGAVLLGAPLVPVMLRRDWRSLFRQSSPLLLFAACVALLTAFRLYYYGAPVPNTFYAKVGTIPVSDGVWYLRRFLGEGFVSFLPGMVVAAFVLPRYRVPFLFAVATGVYAVGIGGDVFFRGRFFMPALPVMLGGGVAATWWLWERRRAAGALAGMAFPFTILFSLYGIAPLPFLALDLDYNWSKQPPPFPVSVKRMRSKVHFYASSREDELTENLAERVRQAAPPGGLVACIGIGKLSYYIPDLKVIDMVGLTDRHISRSRRTIPYTMILPGHSRTDAPYVLARRPDIILIDSRDVITRRIMLPAEADLFADPDFDKYYVFDAANRFYVRRKGV